jgi:hypothetical protein
MHHIVLYCGMSTKSWNSLIWRHPFLGYSTINSDVTMEYVMQHDVTNSSTVGNGVLCGSALIVTLRNNGGILGSGVFCWVCPEAIWWGPMGQVSQSRVEWKSSSEAGSPSPRLLSDSHPWQWCGSPHCCKVLCRKAELVVRHVAGQ